MASNKLKKKGLSKICEKKLDSHRPRKIGVEITRRGLYPGADI